MKRFTKPSIIFLLRKFFFYKNFAFSATDLSAFGAKFKSAISFLIFLAILLTKYFAFVFSCIIIILLDKVLLFSR